MGVMMGTGLVSGTWKALDNILNSLQIGAQPSGFFPTPQREKIKSEMLRAAGGTGKSFRSTQYEMQSVLLTNSYRKRGWVGSPYAKELAVRVKQGESKALAALISGGRK